MKAEIITIGDEILIGQIVDTNSAWMARELNLAGIEIYQVTSVHDDPRHIRQALQDAASRVELVLVTGGLGPTKDDITKKVLCEYFGATLVFHQPTFDHITRRFERRGIPVNRLNRDQALVPDLCTVIPNLNGTAPGMWFEKEEVIYISMPGVPFEMEGIMRNEVLPRLRAGGKAKSIVHRTILTQGIPESILAERIETWENQLPPFIRLAYLPSPMAVRLRMSAYGTDEEALRKALEEQENRLLPLLGDAVYGFDNETMASSIGKLLVKKGQMLAVAESCTGGYVSHLITQTPGCSAWYAGSVTAYANEVKMDVLGVSGETLKAFGAVSREVAEEMASGVRKALRADFSVATTGVAGPDGGTPDKPVGTVWISVAGPTKFSTEKYVFGENRERNILRSSQTALQMLRKLMSEEMKENNMMQPPVKG